MTQARHALLQNSLIPLIFVVDRATKAWAVDWLAPRGSFAVLPFFHLTYLENTGAAWGLFQDSNKALTAVSLLLLAMLFHLRRRWPKENRWSQYGISLVAGGALGNLYDRITMGCVVDFLDFMVWPVFNVADSCITVGACALAWGLRKEEKKG